MDLPVGIAFGYIIQIDQRQATHCATRQRLGHPRTDAAYANDDHSRLLEGLQCRHPIQPRHSAETACVIGLAP